MDLTVSAGSFLFDVHQGVATLTFNRPEVRNAIPTDAILPLAQLFERIAQTEEVRAVFITAKGKHFGGGGDVSGMRSSLDLSSADRSASYYERLENAARMVSAWAAIPQPTVVACQGAVAGAAMMYPLHADFAFADASAFFLCAHQHVGLTPDSGISYFLPRAVGTRRAIELVLGGHRIDVQEAHRIGIISRICMADKLHQTAFDQAQRLAHGPARVLRAAKKLLRDSLATSIGSQLALERDLVAQLVAEPDFTEGVTAFLDKRAPTFAPRITPENESDVQEP